MPQINAIQGAKASFHHAAAKSFYGDAAKILPCETFKDTFEAVNDGRASSAVCAIENTLYGSINQTYDLLLQYDFEIIGEVFLRVEQCLIGLPDSKIEDICEVYSHPVALSQCSDYLDMYLTGTERIEYYDTAASVELIKSLTDTKNAAIASREAAELYGMKILASSIETNKQNYTRFIALRQRDGKRYADSNKTSLIIQTIHKPGMLYAALGAFATRNINLSKLQSRPVIGKAWNYMFYVDVDAGMSNNDLREALLELKQQDCSVKVLGSYLAGEMF